MISPIPYRHVVIDTNLNADKAASILSSALGSLYSRPSIFSWFRGNPRGFKGKVSEDKFTIKQVSPWRRYDSFLLVLYGRFNPHRPGTQIEVQITLRPATIFVLAVFFLACVYEITLYADASISTKSLDTRLIYTIVVMLFGYGLTTFSFNHAADAATDFIQSVYKRHCT